MLSAPFCLGDIFLITVCSGDDVLPAGVAAVNDQDRAGHERRGRSGQEHDAGGQELSACKKERGYALRMNADMARGPKAADQGPAAHLLRNRNFLSLWAGQSVSLIGSSVSFIGLPLVTTEQLGEGNAKLSASQSASEVTGPGIAAGLIALGGSSAAVAADALSYVVSAYCLLLIKVRDTGYGRSVVDDERSWQLSAFWREIQVGFSLLRRDAVLRTVTRSNAIFNFCA